MHYLFNVHSIFFTILGYPMSYIEFFGTILNVLCVWLTAKNRISSWPIGILGTILFAALFLQIQLYADFIEQLYFLVTGFWGWWAWTKIAQSEGANTAITFLSTRMRVIWLTMTIIGTLCLGYITMHLNSYLPQLFTQPASFPYLDSFTTILSFIATILLVRKELEAWYIWLLVDIIGICLYWAKGVHLVAILYVVFLVIATRGLIYWTKLALKRPLLHI